MTSPATSPETGSGIATAGSGISDRDTFKVKVLKLARGYGDVQQELKKTGQSAATGLQLVKTAIVKAREYQDAVKKARDHWNGEVVVGQNKLDVRYNGVKNDFNKVVGRDAAQAKHPALAQAGRLNASLAEVVPQQTTYVKGVGEALTAVHTEIGSHIGTVDELEKVVRHVTVDAYPGLAVTTGNTAIGLQEWAKTLQ